MRRRATRSLLELEGCTWGCAWLSLALVTGVYFANTCISSVGICIIGIIIICIIGIIGIIGVIGIGIGRQCHTHSE